MKAIFESDIEKKIGMKKQDFESRRPVCVKNRVSAVIPVYNGEKYLSHILASILDQTYQQIEIILVDDGSSDGTLQLAEDYRGDFAARGYDYRIIRAEHKNASAAINRGLPYVTGEYLIWPDSDDRLERESVEKRVKLLQNHRQYQAVRSLAYYFDGRTGESLPAEEQTGDLFEEKLFWDILEFRTYVCCGCYMLRTGYFFEIYPERHIPEYDVGQNFQMLLPFMFRHRCATLPEQLYGVCVREGSHSRRKLTRKQEYKKYYDYEKMVDEIAVLCPINEIESKKRIRYWKARRRYQLALKYGDKKQILKNIWLMRKYGQKIFYCALKDFLWNGLCNMQICKVLTR